MLIITAPSKTMDLNPEWESFYSEEPKFLEEAETIIDKLSSLNNAKLKKILKASQKIVDENKLRYEQWSLKKHNLKEAKPATLLYNGDIFVKLEKSFFNKEHQKYLHHNLRILSGLYGLLRGYDLILPYRLEMKAQLKMGSKSNLYKFWDQKITDFMNEDIKIENHKYLIDLASKEYSGVVNLKNITCPVIDVEFLTKTKDELRIVPIYAKMARGSMINFLTKNLIEDPNEMKDFNDMGFKFYKQDNNTFTFIN